jgi:CRP/FNR family transcriptional regulator
MTVPHNYISVLFPFLTADAIEDISEQAIYKEFESDTEILRKDQYVTAVPFVIEGLIKVFSLYEGKELLLYYIESKQSCTMSFASALKREKSRIFAVTETKTKALLIPIELAERLIDQHPRFNTLFFDLFNIRYSELLETINHLLFDKLDTRLITFLKDRMRVTGKSSINMSHKVIANELGTSREVISRILKKLENERILQQTSQGIIFSE